MASRIAGIGTNVAKAFGDTLDLSNKYTNYQNMNLVDQYSYPAMMAQAKAARSGAEVTDLVNLGRAIHITDQARRKAESTKEEEAAEQRRLESMGLGGFGFAPTGVGVEETFLSPRGVSQIDMIQQDNPYMMAQNNPMGDIQSLYSTLLQDGVNPAQALEQSIAQYYPNKFPSYLG